MRQRLALLLLAAIACRRPAGGEPERAPAAVGIVASLTGPEAVYGVPLAQGMRLGLALGGAGPALVEADDQSRPEDARLAAQHLVQANEGLLLLLAGGTSAQAAHVSEVSERAGVALIAAAATGAEVTRLGRGVFRTCFADPFQAEAAARYAREQLGVRRAAVLRDLSSSAYSVPLADAFKARFRALGGELAGDEAYDPRARDHAAAADAVVKSRPELIYLPGYARDVLRLGAELRRAGFSGRLLGGDGWDTASIDRDASGALAGSLFVTHAAPEEEAPAMRAFVARYREAYNEPPDLMATLGYDAGRVGAAALAGASSAEAVTAALARLTAVEGAGGPIRFDGERNAVRAAVLVELAPGGRKVVTRLSP